MGKLNIRKSITINAPAKKIFDTVADFHSWQTWSPWLIQEPEVEVTVAPDGKYYEWSGNRTGSGKMSVLNETPHNKVDYNLTFLKPWKSKAKVEFELTPKDGGTEVAWTMESNWPFFLFWMKKSTAAFIGSDYERGLAMLKDYVEDGKVHSKMDFNGENEFSGCNYIGINTSTNKANVGTKMSEDLAQLQSYFETREDIVAGAPFSIYNKWDMVNDIINYTSAIPVTTFPEDLPSQFQTGTIPATKVYTITHEGPYEHLGNAWSTLFGMQQYKEFKMKKGIPPFEVYVNDPTTTDKKDLLTAIHFAIE